MSMMNLEWGSELARFSRPMILIKKMISINWSPVWLII